MLFSYVYMWFLENVQPVLDWKCQDGEKIEFFYFRREVELYPIGREQSYPRPQLYTRKLTLNCTASMNFLFMGLASLTKRVYESTLWFIVPHLYLQEKWLCFLDEGFSLGKP